ncbi:MAG TPA: hypothetical protein VJU77_16570 [Chthoniobacterales bacterium]|nr:hypothetical protein [Chthoniobacterales bacterium]
MNIDVPRMKTSLKYLPIAALAISALVWPSAKVRSTEELGVKEQEFEENHAARDAYRRQFLEDENGQIPPNAWRDAYAQKQAMPFLPEAWDEFQDPNGQASAVPNVLPWVSIGPGSTGGRIRSIIIHPTNPDTIWVGAVSGGIWKTTNGGTSWSTNTDFLPNIAVNCLAMDPTNPNILYAGTGEGFYANNGVQGNGILKTTDGGANWIPLPNTTNNADFLWVNRLAISPTNPQIVLAATRSGKILRSINGGIDWVITLNSVNMEDVRFRPLDGTNVPTVPEIVTCVAGNFRGQVYYSTDEGLNWTLATGLPAPVDFLRVEVAYAPSDPSIVYASTAADGKLYQLYRTTGGDYNFVAKGGPPGGTGVSFFNNSLWVDPTNPDIVIVGEGGYFWRTTQGGVPGSWTHNESGHADHHVFVEHPGYNGTTNKIVYEGNDGGIFKTTDILQPTPIWTSLNHNLAITQFYSGAGNVASGTIIGGNQDNGTVRFRPQDGFENWGGVFGGDGGFCAADQTDPNYFYGEYVNLQIFRSTNGGGGKPSYIWQGPDGHPEEGIPAECSGHPCADFIAPFVLDSNNPETLLAGGKSLWRSKNAREAQPEWSEIKSPFPENCINNCRYISAIAVAPGDSNIIWVGYGNGGGVFYTTEGTAAHPTWIPANNGLPGRHCTRIAIGQLPLISAAQSDDPTVGGRKVYVTFSAFKTGNVWKTATNGASWIPIHNNLPLLPVYSLVISPSDPEKLYLGTELGVFATAHGGESWSPTGGGHPNALVKELFWMGTKLVSVTHGRGMFTLGN